MVDTEADNNGDNLYGHLVLTNGGPNPNLAIAIYRDMQCRASCFECARALGDPTHITPFNIKCGRGGLGGSPKGAANAVQATFPSPRLIVEVPRRHLGEVVRGY